MNTNPTLRRIFCVVFCFAAVGCKKEEPKQEVTPTPPAAKPVGNSPMIPGSSLFDQLAQEAARRPGDTVKVEQVVELFKTNGIVLGSFQQSLGRTHNAVYCANLRTDDVYVVVCEYANADALKEGRPVTEKIFEQIPNHSFHVVKNTLVMTQALTGPGGEQLAKVIPPLEKL